MRFYLHPFLQKVPSSIFYFRGVLFGPRGLLVNMLYESRGFIDNRIFFPKNPLQGGLLNFSDIFVLALSENLYLFDQTLEGADSADSRANS
jgi:hypothetical protein